MADKPLTAKQAMEKMFKGTAQTLLDIIKDYDLDKDEIVATLELWAGK